jgi:phosphate transport system substrate-binding protein
MRKLTYASMTSAIALAACLGAVEDANAQAIYSGGGTLASKVYRQMFDCVGVPIPPGPTFAACTAGPADGNIQILYSPVGSGGGKRAFLNHDGSSSATIGLGVPATTNTVPFTSTYFPTYGYPEFHFAGSDDVITAADKSTYYTGTNAHGVSDVAQYGALVQLPSLITPITIPFNGKDGTGVALNINPANPNPTGAVSKLDLSMDAVCGIFSGTITQWNDPILTALNGGVVLGTGQIEVVHRSDGSGTTFITSNGLVTQCASTAHPFLFTDRVSTTNPPPSPALAGSDSMNWPDLGTDQFGNPITTPPGSRFVGESGSGGVAGEVASHNGAIGYLSPDFTAMVPPNTLLVANLNDLTNAGFQAPTSANAAAAMASANLGAFTVANVTDPLTWSQIGVVPSPAANTYPLAGITWLDFYQCYSPASGWANLVIPYLLWHYTDPTPAAVIQANGFAPIPSSWFFAIEYLVSGSSSRFGTGGTGVCTGIPGA